MICIIVFFVVFVGLFVLYFVLVQDVCVGVQFDGIVIVLVFCVLYLDLVLFEVCVFFFMMFVEGVKVLLIIVFIVKSCVFYDCMNSDCVICMEKFYLVMIYVEIIVGVGVDVVLLVNGVVLVNCYCVLINLYGGVFLWGVYSGGLVELILIVSFGCIKVISVDYWQGLEYIFFLVSDDVEVVYCVLFKQYWLVEIGIYGCLVGGIFIVEVVVCFIYDGVLVFGVIGIFCGLLLDFFGDLVWVVLLLNGQGVLMYYFGIGDLLYFCGVDLNDLLVQLGWLFVLLVKFLLILLIIGICDMVLSLEVCSQVLLQVVGVEVELYVWEGMWYLFFFDLELFELCQVYCIIVEFFDWYLGYFVCLCCFYVDVDDGC